MKLAARCLSDPCCSTQPASSRASSCARTLVPVPLCSLARYNMRTSCRRASLMCLSWSRVPCVAFRHITCELAEVKPTNSLNVGRVPPPLHASSPATDARPARALHPRRGLWLLRVPRWRRARQCGYSELPLASWCDPRFAAGYRCRSCAAGHKCCSRLRSPYSWR